MYFKNHVKLLITMMIHLIIIILISISVKDNLMVVIHLLLELIRNQYNYKNVQHHTM